MASGKVSARRQFKAFRKKFLPYIPFIRRGRHERIVARMKNNFSIYLNRERQTNEGMGRLFLWSPQLAHAARCLWRVALKNAATDELCLFVTHMAGAQMKPHVIDHVNALMDAGIAVVLIANTDVDAEALQVPEDLAARLHGCLVRENVGYDFAAWAHAYHFINPGSIRCRLYLINDSIVGPLSNEAYGALLQRIRMSPADLVGLTANPYPRAHLQSYYLVFNERLLHSEISDAFMRRIVSFPVKQNVIDCYELWLSSFIEENGFRSAAIFPPLSAELEPSGNDTIFGWPQLIEIGFPFIKSMVLKDPFHAARARRMLPARYL